MDEMEELKQEFLSEAFELLNTMEDGSLKLEKNPEDTEAIAGIFRVAHTLKGGAASLELTRVANFTHELENLFDQVRDGKIKVDEEIIDIILKSLDILKAMIDAASKSREPEAGLEETTLANIIRAQKKSVAPVKEAVRSHSSLTQKNAPAASSQMSFSLTEYEKEKAQEAREAGKKVFWVKTVLNPDYEMRSVSGLQIYTALKESGEILSCQPAIDAILEEEFVPEIFFLFSTELESSTVYEKTYISDVTSSVDLQVYGQENGSSGSQAGENALLSQEVQDKITRSLNSGKGVFRVTVEIEKDNPMRNVDSLLIYNTLEELGEVISARPTKEELRADQFFQFLEVVVGTSEPKEKIKDKCSISGTTRSVKIGTFKAREGVSQDRKEDLEIKKSPEQKAVPAQEERAPKNVAPAALQQKEAAKNLPNQSAGSAGPKSFLRVESGRVDILMNLVSELVISKAGLIETAQQILNIMEGLRSMGAESRKNFAEMMTGKSLQAEDDKSARIIEFFNYVAKSSWNELDNFENIINIISRVINELQESVMKIRMVPIGSIFNRFPRIVRDLAKSLNKDIELVLYGEETELDKSVIEELLDPMVHMVRNSIDHGVEGPEERKAKGKSPKGKITLGASHEGSMIKIEIEDDGNGLDSERIKAKAIERGLITETKELSKEELLHLIFQPGFSTASVVTEVSGRGVGMDVVKKKIENLSGSIFVETEKGKGTKFIIKIPLTLAIIQALIVEINGYSYSIPINNIVETLSITEDQLEVFENNKVIRLRDELITIINLRDIFNFKEARKEEDFLEKKQSVSEDSDELLSKEKYVVVVEMSNKKAGFMVDTVVAEQDIVIKPLHKKYAMTKGISGATILGDGRISLIIDIYQLIDMYIRKEEYITIK